MARLMSWRMASAMQNGAAQVLLAQIEHPDGTVRFWSGLGTLSWNGYSWVGTGTLGTVRPVKRTIELSIQEIQFVLSGVDVDTVATLSDDVRNLAGEVWLACLDDGGQVVPDPLQLVEAQLDYQTHQVAEDGTATIVITARTGFYTLQRALNDRWSIEDQKLRYPADTGLDLIPQLQNQDVQWTPS